MYKLLILILLLLFNYNLSAAEDKPVGAYGKAEIITYYYQKYEARDVSLFQNHVTFFNPVTNRQTDMPIEQVKIFSACTGNKALETAITGGLVGVLLGSYLASSDTDINFGKTVLIATAVSGGLGAIIGFFIDDYEVIYQNKKFVVSDAMVLPEVQSFTLVSYSLSF